MSEMEERVAHAILQAFRNQGVFVSPIFADDPDGMVWQGKMETLVDGNADLIGIARAAIEAMREPTEAMVNTPERLTIAPDYVARETWAAMIDAALTPASGHPTRS